MTVREVPLKTLKVWLEMADEFMCDGCREFSIDRKGILCPDCGVPDMIKGMKSYVRGRQND